MLTVTAQQSRFHNEAIEGSALKEIIVKDLSISIGQKEILNHAQFQLQVGTHYVLVGRNGIGKSTLLQAIATDRIPSIPQSVRVLLLGQTMSNLEDEMDRLSLESLTVLQHVLQSNKQRETLSREEKILSVAIDNTNEPSAIAHAFRKISHERLEKKTESARRIAIRRSGARGKEARKEQIRLEEELEKSQARLAEGNVTATELAEETSQAADLLSDIQAQMELMGAAEAESNARSVLLGLGFTQESIDQPMSQLSGGWKTRCSLACALCQPSDLLLLDEPTNYLDLPSIIWLERYIQNLPPTTTTVIVTHDRSFADNTADELLVLRELALERFKGNLSTYERERVKTWKYRSRMKDAVEKQKKHMQASIDANLRAAKRTGDDKKLKQAASRKKKLEDRTGLEVSAKGGRFKLNRDLPGYHLAARAEIDVPEFDPPVRLAIPVEPPDLRFPGALVGMEKVCFSYGKGAGRKEVLKDVNLTIYMGERVGIAGLNGSGKSTLVSLMLAGGNGNDSAITSPASSSSSTPQYTPTSGTITHHSRARIALFSQLSVEHLSNLPNAKTLTALSHLQTTAGGSSILPDQPARALLSGLGLTGRVASDVPLALLSGGQKVRLALALLLVPLPPHVLVLDEVTTHLDADSIEGLVRCLRGFKGAICVVSHDRFFVRCVVEGVSVGEFARGMRAAAGLEDDGDDDDEEGDDDDSSDEEKEGVQRKGTVYRLARGKLMKLEGGMERYEEIAAKASSKLGKA